MRAGFKVGLRIWSGHYCQRCVEHRRDCRRGDFRFSRRGRPDHRRWQRTLRYLVGRHARLGGEPAATIGHRAERLERIGRPDHRRWHGPLGISSDGTHVWVTNRDTHGSVAELDASDGSFVQAISVGNDPDGVSSDGTHVWVANGATTRSPS